ncbi:MAG: DUF1194 domain-containing protein [Pseudomonadota bacterium]
MRNDPASFFLTTACLLLLIFSPLPLHAKEAVDVELVLLADASNSIDNAEIKFQRQGYATAMAHPDVLAAIRKGDLGKIAVTFIEWGDEYHQKTVVPWMIVRDQASAELFAKALFTKERLAYGSNAIGAAISVAHKQIDQNNYEGHRKVIDLSGDSANNWNGIPISDARGKALKAGIIINGLAILCRSENCGGRPVNYDLEQAFAQRIIGGPGSFVVTVDSPARFAQAVRSKLILELASLTTKFQPLSATRR